MSLRRIIARSAFWNLAGMFVGAATGFVTAPFLVHRLGLGVYGVWVWIVSITGYLNLIDLGLRSSITRHVAYLRARQDQQAVNALLSTAQAILSLAAVVAILGTLLLVWLAPRLFNLPQGELWPTRMGLLLSGLTVAGTLALSISDATLYAYQRFDLLNMIEIPVDVVQTILIFYFVGHGGSLITLGSLTISALLAGETAKVAACFGMDRSLRISLSRVSAESARHLFGYGIWKFVWGVGARATFQTPPMIIGKMLDSTAITPYSIATRLVSYAGAFATAAAGMATPAVTTLHAVGEDETERRVFVQGGKYCFIISLYLVLSIILFCRPLMNLWMGVALASSTTLTILLAAGELVPISQWITCSILLGKERHRVMAIASLTETIAVVALAIILVRPFGLRGMVLAVIAPGLFLRGVLPIVYTSRLLGVPIATYIARAMLPPLLAALPAAALGWALVRFTFPTTWPGLFLEGGLFSIAFALCIGILIGRAEIRWILARITKRHAVSHDLSPGDLPAARPGAAADNPAVV